MKILGWCFLPLAALLLAASERALAAPPASCAGKFVGTWTVTVLATGQTYRSQIRADGTLTSACPLCPPVQSWTCSGNTFILTSPVSLTHTLSADGRRMSGGCCSATRVGGAAVAAKQPPAKKETLPAKRSVEGPAQQAKAAQAGQSGARPERPPAAEPRMPENYLIFFDRSRAEVPESAQKIVDAMASDFWSAGAKGINIVGHTDAEPVEGKNAGLAQARADAVRAALIGKGVPGASIVTAAAAGSRPLVRSPDGGPEPQNRRVEITLQMRTADDFLIFFDRTIAELTEPAQRIVDIIAQQFRSTGAKEIRIEGHLDPEPVETANAKLAHARADAVRAALLARGLSPSALAIVDAGGSRPLVRAAVGGPEPQNRRVEITLKR